MTAEFDELASRAAAVAVNDVPDPMSRRTTKQILVAGIGNAWLRDDGFGGEVAKVLLERPMPDGVTVLDFGSGGLDLAYEVMRGYDGLVLVDVSRQGGEPGTLYVMEAHADDVDGQIEDGQMLNPHGMDQETVLRFVKYVGGWPGRVMVIACEPERVEDVGMGLSDAVQASVQRAADLVLETIGELGNDCVVAPRSRGSDSVDSLGGELDSADA